jgi:hypothetical protein
MITGILVDTLATVLLYRWLFVGGYALSHKSRAERATEFAIRVGLAWAFPLIALWLLYATTMEKLGLFKEKEVAS